MAQLLLTGTVLTSGSSLEEALQRVQERLDSWASNADAYNALLLQVFGAQSSDATSALQAALSGSGLGIGLEILAGATLRGINGAHTSAAPNGGEAIYLNAAWLQSATAADIEAVLLEEIGHAIDYRLNGAIDTRGDEGEIFSALLRSTTPASSAFSENDQRLINLNGMSVTLEAAADTIAPTGSLGSYATDPAYAAASVNPFGISSDGGQFLGNDASPALADIDGDGDLDLFVGNGVGNMLLLRNIATAGSSAPTYAPFTLFGISDVGAFAKPAFADIDGDGDLDLFIGERFGNSLFFSNTGNASVPAYAAAVANPFGIGDLGNCASPAFADIDGDGDLDLFIGNAVGDIYFFRNSGNAFYPSYAAASKNPFGFRNIGGAVNGGYASPAFADFDRDGDLDLFVGNQGGFTRVSENTGSATAPAFAPSYNSGISDVGNYASPAFADLDGDGDLDVFVGNRAGNILMFLNTAATAVAPVASSTANGSYGIGAAITLTVQFSAAVFVDTTGGTPTLQLKTGAIDRFATYTYGSGSNTLSFSYIVEAGDTTADLDQLSSTALTLHGGTIRDAAGNNAILYLAAPGATGSLGANAQLVIDGMEPTGDFSSSIATDTGATTTISTGGLTKDSTLGLAGTYADANGVSSVEIYIEIYGIVVDYDDGYSTAYHYDYYNNLLGNATLNSGSWSFTTSALPDGLYNFFAKVIDNAGNNFTILPLVTATVDAIAPTGSFSSTIATDTGATTTISSGGLTKDSSLGLAGTYADANGVSSVEIYDGLTKLGNATLNSGDWSFTTSALVNGLHSLTAKVIDNAGNTVTTSPAVTATVDTIAPYHSFDQSFIATDTGATTTISSGGLTKDSSLGLAGTYADLNGVSSVEIYDGLIKLGNATIYISAFNTPVWSFTTSALVNGLHSFTAEVTDNAGNTVTTSPAVTAKVDTTAPTGSFSDTIATNSGATTTISTGGVTKDSSLGLAGTYADANGVSSVEIYDAAIKLGNATLNSGAWSFTTSALVNGLHSFTAKVIDNAGNTATTSPVVTATVDTIAPTANFSSSIATDSGATTTISSGGLTKDSSLGLAGTYADANGVSSVEIYEGVIKLGTATLNNGAWSFTTSVLVNGPHSFTAKVIDNAGNIVTTSAAVTATVDTIAPTANFFGTEAPAYAAAVTNPFGIRDVGRNASPAFADVDGDGDLDLFIGENYGNTLFFRNTANPGATAPAYAAAATNPFGISNVGLFASPALADADGDGDLDLFIGVRYGNTLFFSNTGSATAPAYAAAVTNPFGITNVSGSASPAFADVDADGDLDLFIGNGSGNTLFFSNTAGAGATAPAYAAAATNPFGISNVASKASPALADADGDGDLDLFIGNYYGNTVFFSNTANATTPAYAAAVTNPFGIRDVGRNASPAFADANADGNLDLFIGNFDGNTVFFRNTAPANGVSSTNANGSYGIGAAITITVLFSEAVYVTTTGGTPTLQLETGAIDRFAAYSSGSGSNTLSFLYTVQAGDTSPDLNQLSANALTLNGGTIQDAAGNNSILTLGVPGATGSLGANARLVIDTTAPTGRLSSVIDTYTAATPVAPVGSSTANGSYGVGSVITLTVQFSEVVFVVGTPQLQLETGAIDRFASYSSGGGTNTLSFLYIVQAGDISADLDQLSANALTLNGGTIQDLAGNNAILTLAVPGAAGSLGANAQLVIDTIAPTGSFSDTIATNTGATTTISTGGLTKDSSLGLVGTYAGANGVSSVEIYDGVINLGTASLNSGAWSFTTSTLVNRLHSFTAKVIDNAGNTTTISPAVTASVDTTAPTGSLVATAPAYAPASTNPFGISDVGDNARPAFADVDVDGDLDLFIGNRNGNTFFFSNTAASGAIAPAYAAAVTNPFGIRNVGSNASPAFADADGDGDLDLFIGTSNGNTLFFRNTANPGATAPAYAAAVTNPFGISNVGSKASPAFADADADGDLDLFIGDNYGNTVFCRNTANPGATAPAYAAGAIDPFGISNVGNTASPAFADADADGDLDLFIGQFYGNTLFFRNTAALGATAPAYAAAATNPFGISDVGYDSKPAFADAEADGDLDLFIGTLNGNTLFFLNTAAAPVAPVNSSTANGSYGVGSVITLTVQFSEAVLVTGIPQLQLETGAIDRFATYSSGSGSNTLSFRYTVQAGDTSADLDQLSAGALTLNGGTIQDAAGNNAVLTLALPGATGSLGANAALVIDGVAPATTAAVTAITDNVGIFTGIVATGSTTDDSSLSISGTISAALATGETVRIYDGSTYLGIAPVTGTTWSYADIRTLTNNQSVSYTAQVADAVGNQSAAGSAYTVTVDTTAPAVSSFTLSDSALQIGDTATVTLTFSEAVTGFSSAADIAVANGVLSAMISADDGVTWTGTFTPTTDIEDAANILSLANTYADTAGNTGVTATTTNYSIDTKAPAVSSFTLSDSALQIGDTATVTLTFSEAVTGFSSAADITVANGVLSAMTSADDGVTWTGTFTPTTDIEDAANILSLANTYADTAGNTGVTATAANYSIDTTAPVVSAFTLSDSALQIGDTATVTLTFSEAVTGFSSAADIDVANGVLSAMSSADDGVTWTGTFTPTTDIEDAANILSLANTYADTAGNTGVTATTTNYSIDTLAPTTTSAVTAITDNVGIFTGTVATGATTDDDTSLSISGTISAALAVGETVRIYDGITYLGNASVTGTTWSYADSRPLSDNQSVSYTARVADAAGNQSAAGSSYAATLDLTAPANTAAVTAITDNAGILTGTVATGATTDDTCLLISGTISAALVAGETVRIYDGSTYLGNASVSGTTWSYADGRPLSDHQSVSYTAQVTDAAGNQSAAGTAYTATVVNEAPTALALANDIRSLDENRSTSVRIKVADILIIDDALGTEILSLSGADANSFELDGNSLFVKAGTALDYEAKSAYAVNVSARDFSLLGSNPVSAGFSLNIADISEVPGTSAVTTIVSIVTSTGEIRQIPITVSGASFSSGSEMAIISVSGINQESLATLNRLGINRNSTGVDFVIDTDQGKDHASLSALLDLVAAELLPQLSDGSGRLANRKLLYYALNSVTGSTSALTYDPITGAGARFFDTNNDGTPDFFALSLIDGGYGDNDGLVNGKIDDPSFAGFADLTNLGIRSPGSGIITISDPVNTAPAAISLRADLTGRPSSSNYIGYVVLTPDELPDSANLLNDFNWLRGRAQALFSTLESTDVTLPTNTRFERDILLINGQSLRFFEVQDASLNQLTSLGDTRFRYLNQADLGNTQASFSSSSGVRFSLSILPGDPGLNALISQAQVQAPLLDLSALTTAQHLQGTVALGREADLNSVAGFYRSLDAQGTIVAADGITRLKPGDGGYRVAALRSDNLVNQLGNLSVADNQTSSRNFVDLAGGSFLAPYALVNGNTFFAYGAANSDGISHFRSLGNNLFGLEDIAGGGDLDYDDLLIGFNFTSLI